MIPKIQARGKSFKGLADYLTHDPKAETQKRVAWTHTLNLTHDHIPSAVDEMLWTARAAELLKEEAGIRAGGKQVDDPVKHFSINWSPEDNPSQEHMIKTTEDFLRHMKWQEHQAVLVAHNDKEYAHVHVMLNCIHPETGRCLNDSFEQRRAQAWALNYEKENGRIYCEQRLLNADEREDSPTRPAWMAFRGVQKEFEQAEKVRAENDLKNTTKINGRENSEFENRENVAAFSEWKILKEIQRGERQAFFAEGKNEFSELRRAVTREVREEFREGWGNYYAACRDGMEPEQLAAMKDGLLAAQKEKLEVRRDEACQVLREERDGRYRDLLAVQKDIRADLRGRQAAGLDNEHFLDLVARREPGASIADTFAHAAGQATDRSEPPREVAAEAEDDVAPAWSPATRSGVKSPGDAGASLATGLGFGLLSFFDSIADGLTGSRPAPPPRPPRDDKPAASLFDTAVEEAQKRQQQENRVRDEEEWRKKQRSPYGD
jgi:hypothetical protein